MSTALKSERAFVALGSNMAAPVEQINAGFVALGALPATRVLRKSSLYRTAPIGYADQPDFCNAVAALDTQLSAQVLLQHLLTIEKQRGRVRGERNGPRTLDLDLLLYDDRVIREEGLEVPHPRMRERAFVMVPLAEIAPELEFAGHGTAQQLAQRLREAQRIELWDSNATA